MLTNYMYDKIDTYIYKPCNACALHRGLLQSEVLVAGSSLSSFFQRQWVFSAVLCVSLLFLYLVVISNIGFL